MNRRQAVISMLAALAAPAVAQNKSVSGQTSGGILEPVVPGQEGKHCYATGVAGSSITSVCLTDEERLAQYHICQKRGHVGKDQPYWGGQYGINREEGLEMMQWKVCEYCGTRYKVVVTSTVEDNPPTEATK